MHFRRGLTMPMPKGGIKEIVDDSLRFPRSSENVVAPESFRPAGQRRYPRRRRKCDGSLFCSGRSTLLEAICRHVRGPLSRCDGLAPWLRSSWRVADVTASSVVVFLLVKRLLDG